MDIEVEDLEMVVLKASNEEMPKSCFVRFVEKDKRMEVWSNRSFAKKNGLFLEEFLTSFRQKLYLKCKDLKAKGLIKDVITRSGDIYALTEDGEKEIEKTLVITDNHFESLLRTTKAKGVTKNQMEEGNGEKDAKEIVDQEAAEGDKQEERKEQSN